MRRVGRKDVLLPWHAAVTVKHLHVLSSACARLQGHRGNDPRGQLWRKVSGLAALAEQLAAAREAADPFAPAARDTSHGAAGTSAPTDRPRPREAVPPAAWGGRPQGAGPYATPARGWGVHGPAPSPGGGPNVFEGAGAHAAAPGPGVPLPGSMHVRRGTSQSSPRHRLVGQQRLTLDAAHRPLLQGGEAEAHRMVGMGL